MFGLFISMEGADGSGKSTQIKLLEEYLKRQNLKVVLIREPGTTKIGEQIRNVLLDTKNVQMDYMCEFLLYCASRAQLIKEIIKPELKNGSVVIADRYIDSSAVYQGIVRHIGVGLVEKINGLIVNDIKPDLTLLLDIDTNEAIRRKKEQKQLDRMEIENFNFHRRVVEGYKIIASRNQDRIITIDANGTKTDINKKIIYEIDKIFNKGL